MGCDKTRVMWEFDDGAWGLGSVVRTLDGLDEGAYIGLIGGGDEIREWFAVCCLSLASCYLLFAAC
jgi:hypothetical protein